MEVELVKFLIEGSFPVADVVAFAESEGWQTTHEVTAIEFTQNYIKRFLSERISSVSAANILNALRVQSEAEIAALHERVAEQIGFATEIIQVTIPQPE